MENFLYKRQIDLNNIFDKIALSLLSRIKLIDNELELLKIKIMSRMVKNDKYIEFAEKLLKPYTANIIYSHKNIINELKELFYKAYGKNDG